MPFPPNGTVIKFQLLSHNCGHSKTDFWGVFPGFESPKWHFLIACRRSVCRIAKPVRGLRRLLSIRHSAQKSTECDIKSTDHDMKSTAHDILTTLGDTFTTLRAPRKSRLTSIRLRFFDFENSCGCAQNSPDVYADCDFAVVAGGKRWAKDLRRPENEE